MFDHNSVISNFLGSLWAELNKNRRHYFWNDPRIHRNLIRVKCLGVLSVFSIYTCDSGVLNIDITEFKTSPSFRFSSGVPGRPLREHRPAPGTRRPRHRLRQDGHRTRRAGRPARPAGQLASPPQEHQPTGYRDPPRLCIRYCHCGLRVCSVCLYVCLYVCWHLRCFLFKGRGLFIEALSVYRVCMYLCIFVGCDNGLISRGRE